MESIAGTDRGKRRLALVGHDREFNACSPRPEAGEHSFLVDRGQNVRPPRNVVPPLIVEPGTSIHTGSPARGDRPPIRRGSATRSSRAR